MSGTAGLSAAKNRRSGNEVKINGQGKSLPPPEQTSLSARPVARQPMSNMPNPMEILKSHEFRLQELESENGKQDFLTHKVDFLTMKTEFLTLKNELMTNGKKTIANTCDNTSANTAADITALQQRLAELNTIVSTFTKEIASVKQYIREKVEPVLSKVILAAAVPAPLVPAPPLVPAAPLVPAPLVPAPLVPASEPTDDSASGSESDNIKLSIVN